jgi:hypothetical protein
MHRDALETVIPVLDRQIVRLVSPAKGELN